MPPLPEDDLDLDDLPPLEGDDEVAADFDEELPAIDEEGGLDDAEADDLVPGDAIEVEEESSVTHDDEGEVDVGDAELAEDDGRLAAEDAEEPGVGDEDFGLSDDDADLVPGDAGEEGLDEEAELPSDELPALDGGDDDDEEAPTSGEIVDEVPRDPSLPPWEDATWARSLVAGVPDDVRLDVVLDGPAAVRELRQLREVPGCAGATACARLPGPAGGGASFLVGLVDADGDSAFVARVTDGDARLVAEIEPDASGDEPARIDALAWDDARACLWVRAGGRVFRIVPPRRP